MHIAIAAKDRATVDAFYQAAIAAGARDNGALGLAAALHPNYYGAFVLDPDGHNIEAVCHAPGDSLVPAKAGTQEQGRCRWRHLAPVISCSGFPLSRE